MDGKVKIMRTSLSNLHECNSTTDNLLELKVQYVAVVFNLRTVYSLKPNVFIHRKISYFINITTFCHSTQVPIVSQIKFCKSFDKLSIFVT